MKQLIDWLNSDVSIRRWFLIALIIYLIMGSLYVPDRHVERNRPIILNVHRNLSHAIDSTFYLCYNEGQLPIVSLSSQCTEGENK